MASSIPLALGLALTAALFHTVWNVLLKTTGDPLEVATRGVASAAALVSPFFVVLWFLTGRPGLPAHGWLLALASALAEVIYFIFLSRAYRLGALSAVYPLARGTAPLLLVLVGLLILGEHLTAPALGGVALLLAGMLAVRPPRRAGAATVPALLTGVAIATYTTIDKLGVALAAPWLYGWVLWALTGSLLLTLRVLRQRTGVLMVSDQNGTGFLVTLAVGLLMSLTYFLVIFALRLAPLAVIGPVRESAIVLVAAWGIWRLRERELAALRLGGAAAIVAGIAILAAGG